MTGLTIDGNFGTENSAFLTKDADENEKHAHFYEGTEKLLEIWFTSSPAPNSVSISRWNQHSDKVLVQRHASAALHDKALNNQTSNKSIHGSMSSLAVGTLKPDDLRAIPSEELSVLLSHVNATIISVMSTTNTDAYVLSESSMFISSRCFMLKTCGNTTIIKAIRPLLQLVHKYTAFTAIEELFYSRKDFLRPDLQHNMHSTFTTEVKFLDEDFEGSAYCLGRVNDQCWYLYCLNQRHAGKQKETDQCMEILMEQLDPEVMALFTRPVSNTALEATEKSGIDQIIPELIIDDFLFDPCGYSMNGLLRSGHYATIHITPQPAFSYVSFETNVPPSHYSYIDIIQRVLNIFRPGKFLFTMYSTKKSAVRSSQLDLEEYTDFEGFKKMDVQTYSLRNYLLSYLSYVRDIT